VFCSMALNFSDNVICIDFVHEILQFADYFSTGLVLYQLTLGVRNGKIFLQQLPEHFFGPFWGHWLNRDRCSFFVYLSVCLGSITVKALGLTRSHSTVM